MQVCQLEDKIKQYEVFEQCPMCVRVCTGQSRNCDEDVSERTGDRERGRLECKYKILTIIKNYIQIKNRKNCKLNIIFSYNFGVMNFVEFSIVHSFGSTKKRVMEQFSVSIRVLGSRALHGFFRHSMDTGANEAGGC